MKYALLIYAKPGSHESLPKDEYEKAFGEYTAIRNDPACVAGIRLEPTSTATTVRVDGHETLVTDGPFAETKEVLGGLFLFEAGDLDAALAVAARIPAARLGGAIEVRPVVEEGS